MDRAQAAGGGMAPIPANDGGSYPTEGRITIGATPRVTRQSIDNLVYGVARGRGTEATIRYR